jgi:hypothetical protein
LRDEIAVRFGTYLGPIKIFPDKDQLQLRELFQRRRAPHLEFGLGHRHRAHDSNLLLAVKKSANTLSQ